MKNKFILFALLLISFYGFASRYIERLPTTSHQETLLTAPIANDDNDSTNEDSPVTTAVTANDLDPDGTLDETSVTIVTPPMNGSTSVNTDGTVTYTPAPNFNGTDSYSYEVCEFAFDNLVFLAQSPSGVSTPSQVSTVELPGFGLNPAAALPTSINGIGYNPIDNKLYGMNDGDNDRIAQLYSIKSDGNHAVLTDINPPTPGIFGSAVFWFVGDIDENGTYYFPAVSVNGINPPDYTLYLASIDLTAPIDPINYTPNYSPINTTGGCQPYVDAYMTEVINFYLSGGAGAFPSGGIQDWAFNPNDGLLYSYMGNEAVLFSLDVTTGISNCYSTTNASLSEFGAHFFDPDGNFYGVDSNTGNAYEIAIDCPSATCGNLDFLTTIPGDLRVDGASAPWAGFSPPLCETATVFITVTPVKDPPVALDDLATTMENIPVTIDILSNDSDPDGPLDPNNVAVGPALNGTTVVNTDGTITYTPAPNFSGEDSFFYQICDDTNLCSDAQVTITVIPDVLFDISGTIKSCASSPISQVTVTLSGDSTASTTTALSGDFVFNALETGDYTLTPSKQNAVTSEGLSVIDLMLIQRHIQGFASLSAPCDLIAADVNGSCSLSIIDIILIKRVIQGASTNFPSGNVWHFVPENYAFPTGLFPCGFPEAIDIFSLNQDEINKNFIGIKLGDVNGSAATN